MDMIFFFFWGGGVALWFEAFLNRLFFFNETTIMGNAFLLNATIQTKLMFSNRGHT